MKNLILVLLSILLASSVVFAHGTEIPSIIVATDRTSVDAMIAMAAGHKVGMPVLIADTNSNNIININKIADLETKNIIIVGGPFVISKEAEDSLSMGFNVTRLWGMERTGTGIEIAKYFWAEGSDCAVLTSDTKDSDSDYKIQRHALGIAVSHKCPLIPIPKNEMPEEILVALNDLGAKNVYFVSDIDSQTVRDALKDFTLKVFVRQEKELEADEDKETESQTDNEKLKLVIIASSEWRLGIGLAGHTRYGTIVRFVTSDSNLDEIINSIKAKNITDVRVVGKPELSDSVAAKLLIAGINATRISGEKASAISEELMDKAKDKWAEKREKAKSKLNDLKARIKQNLLQRLEKTEERLDLEEVKLEELKDNDSTAAAEVQAKIDAARARINETKAKIENNPEEGKRLLNVLLDNVLNKKLEMRGKLKIDINEDIKDEEDTNEKIKEKLDFEGIEKKIDKFNNRCKTRVKALLDKAKVLRDAGNDYLEANETLKAAESFREAGKTLVMAKQLSHTCEKGEAISEKLDKITERRADKLNKIETRLAKPALRILAPTERQKIVRPVVKVNTWATGVVLVEPPGTNNTKEAHFHVYIDNQPYQAGANRVFTFENLTVGKHTITAELHHNDHSSYDNLIVKREIEIRE